MNKRKFKYIDKSTNNLRVKSIENIILPTNLLYNLPSDILILIYNYLHDLRKVHCELLSNCARRDIEQFNDTNTEYISYEIALHKSIHEIYSDIISWKEHGWCSVKCGSINWPHACNFCLICNADPDYCSCNT